MVDQSQWETQQVRRYSHEMHCRNILGGRLDYREVAKMYPPLQRFIDKNPALRSPLDFRDPFAQRCLSAALLHVYFGIVGWELPMDRLCPPIPNRLNYILWINDLMLEILPDKEARMFKQPSRKGEYLRRLLDADVPAAVAFARASPAPRKHEIDEYHRQGAAHVDSMSAAISKGGEPTESDSCQDLVTSSDRDEVVIVDIGTGASAIYPLLGSAAFGWRFIGSDVDPRSLENAASVVGAAGLPHSRRIRLARVASSGGRLRCLFDTAASSDSFASENSGHSRNSTRILADRDPGGSPSLPPHSDEHSSCAPNRDRPRRTAAGTQGSHRPNTTIVSEKQHKTWSVHTGARTQDSKDGSIPAKEQDLVRPGSSAGVTMQPAHRSQITSIAEMKPGGGRKRSRIPSIESVSVDASLRTPSNLSQRKLRCVTPSLKGDGGRVMKARPSAIPIHAADEVLLPTAHATMCNPPFFESLREAGHNPATVLTGSNSELVHPGGEMAFIRGIIDDSAVLQKRVCWYTTMVGCKRHVDDVIAAATESGAQTVRQTVLRQGKTLRWCVAWSFFPKNSFHGKGLSPYGSNSPGAALAGGSDGFPRAFGGAGRSPPLGGWAPVVRSLPGIDVKTARERIAESILAPSKFVIADAQGCAESVIQGARSQLRVELEPPGDSRARGAGDFALIEVTLSSNAVALGVSQSNSTARGAVSSSTTEHFELPERDSCCVSLVAVQQPGSQARSNMGKIVQQFADRLQRDVVRTGKAWRRKLRRSEQE